MQPISNIIAIILAAGAGQRMGMPKALLQYKDRSTLLEKQCDLLSNAGCTSICVVIGAEAQKIRDAHQNLSVQWIINEQWELGQFSSLQAGIKKMLITETNGAIVLPVDVAGVSSPIVRALIETALRNPHLDAIIPEYQDRGGHPVYLAKSFCASLATLDPKNEFSRLDTQLAKTKNTIRIPVNDPNVIKNINAPADWNP